MTKGNVTLAVLLLALLAAGLALATFGWTGADPDVSLPTSVWVALIAGVVFSLIVGVGLMALLFYSSRAGYDEPPHRETERNNRAR
jgi:fatty acid desaturase